MTARLPVLLAGLCLLAPGARPLAPPPTPTATATSAGHRSVSSAPQAIATARAESAGSTTSSGAGTYAPSFAGHVVKFGLSGMEPDFDPIYSVVISSTLHDGRHRVPDTTLVLSMYLESFQPDTTPILPDILHPDQTATDLVGFMQGKAVLVNAAGRLAYHGSVLAEVFRDNAVHTIANLFRVGASPAVPPLQLRGIYTLYRGGTEKGGLAVSRPLSRAELATLVVPRGRAMSWQAALQGVTVHYPRMMGTSGSGRQAPRAPQTPLAARQAAPLAHPATKQSGPSLAPIAGGVALLLLAVAAGLLIRGRRTHGNLRRLV